MNYNVKLMLIPTNVYINLENLLNINKIRAGGGLSIQT